MSVQTARKGDWMCTFTGRQFWPGDSRPEDVCIEDLAHALSIENRFAGHLPAPYSVAQHSLLVADILRHKFPEDRKLQLWGLLHDAPEAYLKDIPRPLKSQLGAAYPTLEHGVMQSIATKFGLSMPQPREVHRADE